MSNRKKQSTPMMPTICKIFTAVLAKNFGGWEKEFKVTMAYF
jgi:hypothetical protein